MIFEKVSRLADEEIVMPVRKTGASAGYDLAAADDYIIPALLQLCDEAKRLWNVDDDEFVTMVQDSTDLVAIVSSEYEVLFNDGDPVCPVWWSAGAGYEGWQMLIGKFYVAKYRKFLDLFHEMEVTNPVIFAQMVEKYGYNLDNPDMEIAFYQKTDPAVWATYVLIPLYNYFKALYEANPEHPDAKIDTFADKGTAGTYWKDPVGQLK